jgi:hypothetical protein
LLTVPLFGTAGVAVIGIEAGAVKRAFAAGLVISTVGAAVEGPLQVVPLSLNDVGSGFAEPKVPLKPVPTVALVGRLPFQLALFTVTFWPLCE